MSLPRVQTYVFRALVFLLPLFFLPITGDFFDFNKLALLIVGVLIIGILWAIQQIKEGSLKIRTGQFDLALWVFAIVMLLSALIVTPNKVDAFAIPGTASIIFFGALFYFFVIQRSADESKRDSKDLSQWFLAGGAVTAFISILSTIGFWSSLGTTQPWLNQAFATTGGALASLTLFIVLLPFAISELFGGRANLSKIDLGKFKIARSALAVILLGGGIASVLYLFGSGILMLRILPIQTGWSVALETLKENALLGVGSGNFIEAFSRFRPAEYNLTDFWNLRFTTSSNWYLHVWTVGGLLGIISFLWLVVKAAQSVRRVSMSPVHASLTLTLILFLLLPGNLLLLFTFFLLLSLSASPWASDSMVLELRAREGRQAQSFFPAVALVVLLAAAGVVFYFGGRAYAAEVSYRKALEAAARNDGVATYDALIETIGRNPLRDNYRMTYSQVNLALANSIASWGEEISDQDRQTISQLVQQAIREGKAAVALNQGRAINWENLARIYQALIPFAEGADQFAIASFQQSVALDPVNPNLRIALGGVFYSLEQYEDAIRVFELAVAAKPDLANAHFNLASALRENGNIERATQEMEMVLQLIEEGTNDYQLAQQELESLRGKLAEKEKEAPGELQELTPPQEAQESAITPPIELPADSQPPVSTSPSPIPVPTASP